MIDIQQNNFVCPEETNAFQKRRHVKLKFSIKAFCPYYLNACNLGILLIVFTDSPPQCHQNVILILYIFSEIKICSFSTLS